MMENSIHEEAVDNGNCHEQPTSEQKQLLGKFADISIEKLFPGRNLRKERSSEAIDMLNRSVAEFGVLHEILVVPLDEECFQIVSGFGRYEAAKFCGLKSVPCRILERDLSPQESQQLQLHENWVRENVNPVVVATVLSETMKAENLKQSELGKRFALPQPRVSELLKLLNLSPGDKARVEAGQLSVKAANQLLKHRKRESKKTAKKPNTSTIIRVEGRSFLLDNGLHQIIGDILVVVARAKDADAPLTDRDVKKVLKEFRLPSTYVPAPEHSPEVSEASIESSQ